jgi:protein-export membrane protein SecD
MSMSDTPFWPPAPPPPRPSDPRRYLLAFGMLALVAAYALVAFFTRGVWADTVPQERIRAMFSAQDSDGSPLSADVLSQTKDILQQRVEDVGGSTSEVVLDGDVFTITVPSPNDDVRNLGARGQLHVRPVIHAIPSQSATTSPPSPPPPGTDAKLIADEKTLRQSIDQQIQMLALQFQTTRCDQVDHLIDHDDPKLPLVTCSQDGKTVYLLAPSIIGGEQIDKATSGFDRDSGQYVVDMEFKDDAAALWTNFTAANVGTQTAFTLDTRVVSAPEIREAIPGGRTQISGQFTRDSARELAAAIHSGALPVSLYFMSAEAVTVPGQPHSMLLRVALVSSGIGVMLMVIFGVVFLLRRRPRPDWPNGQGIAPS